MPPAPSLLVMAKRPTVVPIRASAAASTGTAGGGVLIWSAIDEVPAGFRNSNLSCRGLPKRLWELCRVRQGQWLVASDQHVELRVGRIGLAWPLVTAHWPLICAFLLRRVPPSYSSPLCLR